MKNTTISYLHESDSKFGIGVEIMTENQKAFEEIEEATVEVKQLLGYTLEKVCVHGNKNGRYYLEYANNIERYMQDQKIYTIEEAITDIVDEYSLSEGDISIIVDESCIDKLDISALKEKYNIIKK